MGKKPGRDTLSILFLRVGAGSENEMPLNSLPRSSLFPLCCWSMPGGPWPQDDHLTNPIKSLIVWLWLPRVWLAWEA